MSVKSKVLFPDSLYAKDPARWRFALLRDAVGFVVFWILACWLPFPWSLLAGVLCGGAIAALFVLGHDAAHGTYSTDAHRNARVAQLLLLPSLTPVPLWKLGHNRIHHGLTGLPADWIWHPASPADYKNMNPVERGWYRVCRSPWGFWLYYTVEVWWRGMAWYSIRNREHRNGWIPVLLFLVAWFWLSAMVGGLSGVATGLVLPLLVFQETIGFVVFVNHTHPRVGFHASRTGWNAAEVQLRDSTTYKSRFFGFWLHNILYHVPHHVDTRIPWFALPEALDILAQAFPHLIIERESPVRSAFRYARACFLYDFDRKLWIPRSPSQWRTPERPPEGNPV
ncbi:fatty acid desaturase family protein [Acidithiobacillus caldus]|uniref:Fatty acid desaturase n=1 Tax=Acidithiobacillus caldus (strain ATCC 51756 / DSM 8584 / KU) TaxID=637389 RepID=A0A059ZV12_ACICK|nr:fatty acid desaturase [Acidithiobacillus caldus]AIA55465.1 fatty acid desaturase [Acidithiobacillus caldus ATCC 51756]MBU2730207.1 hypothetical protein [Acidithiobacillus caldus]MBU2734833.1 hypothetical protein [Acidithiobacillus caldus ATCC 51756]MBU2745616.1 hypothetical protein [Acidithiobacillus caldus]MBU2763465.1 hypothetical protein [Acidithiobacillus caldus]